MDDWEVRYQALLSTHQRLERDFNVLKNQLLVMKAEKKSWELERVTQQKIIRQALQEANATSNSYLEENNQLKEQIRELTKG